MDFKVITCKLADEQAMDFVEAAQHVPNLQLPGLTRLGILLQGYDPPYIHHGTPLAPEQGATGVCNQVGALVSGGVLPALRQASMTSTCSRSDFLRKI
jgi:hypothetical protein